MNEKDMNMYGQIWKLMKRILKIYEKGKNMDAKDTNRYERTWTYFKRQFNIIYSTAI
jgi:hypothetical protein